MRSLLLSGMLLTAIVALGACGAESVPSKEPPPGTELETITLSIEGMT